MSKAAIITDLHFGARSDSLVYDRFFEKFYTETFFPYLKQHGIKKIFCLGDVFDRRKFVNFNILKSCKRYFFDQLKDYDTTILAGNHDVFYKNTNEVNSLDLLLAEYPNIKILINPEEVVFGNTKILMVPWINSGNYLDSLEALKNTDAKVCFGHFEIAGFQMYRGHVNDHGMSKSLFQKFDLVCSGHFHHKSSDNGIHYLGNPYEFTWTDYGDTRGFHIFDSETLQLDFIENPNRIFHKIYYDDEKMSDILQQDFEKYRESNIKVIVENKTDYYTFDRLLEKLYQVNPIELKIIEDFAEFEDAESEESIDVEDTLTLLSQYVDAVETDMDKNRIKKMLKSLYVEAIALDRE